MRRAWNLPDKRAVLSSVANIMLCGAADVHPDFEREFTNPSSLAWGNTGDGMSKRSEGESQGAQVSERERLVGCLT